MIVRFLLVVVLAMATLRVVGQSVCAQGKDGGEYMSICTDSALIGVLTGNATRAVKWADAMRTIATDSDMVCVSQCIKASVDASNGKKSGITPFTNAIRHFTYRKDSLALRGLSVAYCALGYYDYETSIEPNDIYFKKAERLARELGDQRLELTYLSFRAQMYLRSERLIEASYCVRNIMAQSNENELKFFRFWGKLIMLRIYSAVRIESVVTQFAESIDTTGFYLDRPSLVASFCRVMAIDALRKQSYTEANVMAWRALSMTEKYRATETELWLYRFIRALTLFYTDHLREAESLADTCERTIKVLSPISNDPFRSLSSLTLLKSQIAQKRGDVETARRLLSEVRLSPKLLNSSDFAARYYDVIEKYAVSCGDYATARKAVETADYVQRITQLKNARILCKDMAVATREDSLLISKRQDIKTDEEIYSSRKDDVTLFVIVSFAVTLLIFVICFFRIRRKERQAQENELNFTQKLADEVKRNTTLIEGQNQLIAKSNLDLAASRSYAKRMQRGILPNPNILTKWGLLSSFVLRGTTEAISSCFYWYRKIDDRIMVCCGDTGLGNNVSGALLSVVGLTLFNDATSKYGRTANANDLLLKVKETFHKYLPDENWRSELTLSVAVVDTANKVINVACAYSFCYVYNNKMLSIVADTVSRVAGSDDALRAASDIKFNYSPGDAVFLFSKSFPKICDAKGDEIGKSRIKTILERTVKLPASLHHDAILNEILYLRNGRIFNDDALLVGFTLK